MTLYEILTDSKKFDNSDFEIVNFIEKVDVLQIRVKLFEDVDGNIAVKKIGKRNCFVRQCDKVIVSLCYS